MNILLAHNKIEDISALSDTTIISEIFDVSSNNIKDFSPMNTIKFIQNPATLFELDIKLKGNPGDFSKITNPEVKRLCKNIYNSIFYKK